MSWHTISVGQGITLCFNLAQFNEITLILNAIYRYDSFVQSVLKFNFIVMDILRLPLLMALN